MSRPNRLHRSQHGYVLAFVMILTTAVVAVSVAVSMVSRVEATASTQDVNAVNAFSIAYSGMQNALRALRQDQGNLSGIIDDLLAPQSEVTVGTANLVFHNSDTGGCAITPSDPGGADGCTRYNVGRGYYRLFMGNDINENDPAVDTNSTVTIRSYGRYLQAEAMIESNFRVLDTEGLAAAFVGCFANRNAKMILDSMTGPGLPFFLFRIDGAADPDPLKKRPPMAFNVDPYRMDGLQVRWGKKDEEGNFANRYMFYQVNDPDPLYASAQKVAPTHLNQYPDADVAIDSPSIGFGNPPFGLKEVVMALKGASWGTGAAVDGLAGDSSGYRIPVIAFKTNPQAVEAAETQNPNYNGKNDEKASHGVYGCFADVGKNSQYEAAGLCTTGNSVLSKSPAVDWDGESVMQSGLAWNYIQTVIRKCKGSGGSVSCPAPYGYLTNIAKCLILPDNTIRNDTTVGDTGGDNANYKDYKVTQRLDGTGPNSSGSNQYSWYPGGYPRFKVTSFSSASFQALSNCADDASGYSDSDDCTTQPDSTHYPDMHENEALTLKTLMQEGVCVAPDGKILVKFCNTDTLEDSAGRDCGSSLAAWLPSGCDGIAPSNYFKNVGNTSCVIPNLSNGLCECGLTGGNPS
ncbi:MAG: hypothetical protein JXR83_02585 [Deltaproteobacteria bacterium]|nr:hypothetical protein [Deltaproteobacteria bacterium]